MVIQLIVYLKIRYIGQTGDPTPWGSWTFINNNPGVDQNITECLPELMPDCFAFEIWDPVCGCVLECYI